MGIFIFILVTNIKEWNNNNKQPIIPVSSRASGKQYGLMVVGDIGILSFQGTRFISFDRDSRY